MAASPTSSSRGCTGQPTAPCTSRCTATPPTSPSTTSTSRTSPSRQAHRPHGRHRRLGGPRRATPSCRLARRRHAHGVRRHRRATSTTRTRGVPLADQLARRRPSWTLSPTAAVTANTGYASSAPARPRWPTARSSRRTRQQHDLLPGRRGGRVQLRGRRLLRLRRDAGQDAERRAPRGTPTATARPTWAVRADDLPDPRSDHEGAGVRSTFSGDPGSSPAQAVAMARATATASTSLSARATPRRQRRALEDRHQQLLKSPGLRGRLARRDLTGAVGTAVARLRRRRRRPARRAHEHHGAEVRRRAQRSSARLRDGLRRRHRGHPRAADLLFNDAPGSAPRSSGPRPPQGRRAGDVEARPGARGRQSTSGVHANCAR